jgi:hypothetical protein
LKRFGGRHAWKDIQRSIVEEDKPYIDLVRNGREYADGTKQNVGPESAGNHGKG